MGPGGDPSWRYFNPTNRAKHRLRDSLGLQMPTGKVRLAGTEQSPLFLLLPGGCRELLHDRRTLPSPGHLAWARAWGRPGLGPGNQHQEETRSDSSAGFTSRAPDRLAPPGQGLPATGRARRVQPRPRLWRSGEAGSGSARSGDERSERALRPSVAACGDPPPGPASPARGSARSPL